MSCGGGHRLDLDPALRWLWCRPAATALIGHLAWEPIWHRCSTKKTKKKKKKKELEVLEKNFSYIERIEILSYKIK